MYHHVSTKEKEEKSLSLHFQPPGSPQMLALAFLSPPGTLTPQTGQFPAQTPRVSPANEKTKEKIYFLLLSKPYFCLLDKMQRRSETNYVADTPESLLS